MVTFVKEFLSKAFGSFSYIPDFLKSFFTSEVVCPKISNVEQENKFALVIGCSYSHNRNIKIDSSTEEAKEMKNMLLNRFGFLESNILLLVEDNSSESFKPTVSSIKKSLKLLQSYAEKGKAKLIYIFYSGLGSERRDLDFDLTSDNVNESIIPTDFEENGIITFEHLKEFFLMNLDESVTCVIVSDTCNMKSMDTLDYHYNPLFKRWVDGVNDTRIKANILMISSFIDESYFDELEKNGRIGGIIKYCLERYMSDENSFEKIIELSNRECRRIKVGRVLILSSTKKENGNYTF